MSFKEMLLDDVKNILINSEEFAEIHTVRYDGEVYENIPAVVTKLKQSDRAILKDDHLEGVFLVSTIVYIAEDDLNGIQPEHGKRFEIDDGEAAGEPYFMRYEIVTSKCEHGMITLELRRYDE